MREIDSVLNGNMMNNVVIERLFQQDKTEEKVFGRNEPSFICVL
jgi:hypothetical protein